MELLSINTTVANSADFTVGATAVTLILKTASGILPENSVIYVEVKADTNYYEIGRLTKKEPVKAITAPGTYRVRRSVVAYAVGVEKEA
jgi:hypothetical protein